MKRGISFLMILSVIFLLSSCNNKGNRSEREVVAGNIVKQDPDGTISLSLDKAECYDDADDPSSNTAEWNVVVSKSGRFNVWLSSATKDTAELSYQHDVLISVQDTRLTGHPGNRKIIHDSRNVAYPYFRADSFLGSMYIQDTGKFNVQVICEKIHPSIDESLKTSGADLSKLISVSLTPVTR
jgi:hypothetical protein